MNMEAAKNTTLSAVFKGEPFAPGDAEMLASNGGIHQEMITLLIK